MTTPRVATPRRTKPRGTTPRRRAVESRLTGVVVIATLVITATVGVSVASTDDIVPSWIDRPVGAPAVPDVTDRDWSRSDIDRFTLATLERLHIPPAPEADRRTYLRRVTFDLTGLPPTLGEMTAFLTDPHGDAAFEAVVDRLLASPRYGERWGRHWLDLVRYADTTGDGTDMPIPEAHLYRDYVIDAFNDDLPYDEFLVEQLAGDILATQAPSARDRERRIATGFVALSRRFGNGTYSDLHLVIDNTIETVGESMLGLSVQCARCHDHKFDPISTRDYYGWYGMFASTQYPHAGSEHGKERLWFLPLEDDPKRHERYRLRESTKTDLSYQLKDLIRDFGQLNDLKKRVAESERDRDILAFQLAATTTPPSTPDVEKLTQLDADVVLRRPRLAEMEAADERLTKLAKERDGELAYGVQERVRDIGDSPIFRRGDPEDPGEIAKRGGLSAIDLPFPPIPENASGRLELARWITDPAHPLTARVMANRIWQYHFGRGLVSTPSQFGSTGAAATHPALLDWLATRFVELHWSIKEMHREIVLSSTYRMASRPDPRALDVDPDGRWLSHVPSRRLDAEEIRDATLATSGRLLLTSPPTHRFPTKLRFTQHQPFRANYDHEHRSVYLMSRRLGSHPFLCLFDGPDTNRSTSTRQASAVPQQALFTMNSPFANANARAFAHLLLRQTDDRDARIERAFQRAYLRQPTDTERDAVTHFLAQRESNDDEEAWTSLCRALLSANEFIWID